MSRQTHLPPRCPFQKKTITRLVHDSMALTPYKDAELYTQHHKSQSAILEEQPAWLDDLLNDSDSNSKRIFHRRAASDSVTLLDGIVPLPSPLFDDESSSSCVTSSGLESACMYGPNSPRRRGKLTFPEIVMVSALSDYVSHIHLQYLDGDFCISQLMQFDSIRDVCGSVGEVTAETKPTKRHSGQRSRVRKLQYIAEPERTVKLFETAESELAVRVASLLQQRTALSMENSRLKQQVAQLHQEKVIVDGQYQSLEKEVERLKICLAYSTDKKFSTNVRPSSAAEGPGFAAMWQMLDLEKLHLN